MDSIEALFDYQRFKGNARLAAHTAQVYERYLAQGDALGDDALKLVAAAGEPKPLPGGPKPGDAADRSDG